MELILDIIKNGKNIPEKRNFHFEEKGGSIGRIEDNDWVLTDQNSYISGHHATIIYKHGSYFIKDESTNGTYLKNPYKKLPKGHPIEINASDVFIIGDHELQARYSNNDYSEDDIISSFEDTSSNEDIIPNDDFLCNSEILPEISENINIIDTPLVETILEADVEIQEDILENHILAPTYCEPKQPPTTKKISKKKDIKKETSMNNVNDMEASIAILESKLGLSINSLDQSERDVIMSKIGDFINNTLNYLQNSIQIKDKIKQDLDISAPYLDTENNNPIKLGSAAAKLLQDENQGMILGMMPVEEAMAKSFNELDSHSIALHSASKNIIKIGMKNFAPKNLEYKFETNGSLRGVLPKQQLIWKAYVDMFNDLNKNPDKATKLIHEDFKREYENTSYSLKLHISDTRKGL